MFDLHEFYRGFQINYYDYKQLSNKHLLTLTDDQFEEIYKEVVGKDKKDFLRSVKIDIRLTFLLSIETLFELIFALLPDRNNHINEQEILLKLIEKTFHYEDIRKYHNGEASRLDALTKKLPESNGQETNLLWFIFYRYTWNKEINQRIEKSLSVIEKALKIFAYEVRDRAEINSYKHGLRSIPFFSKFMVARADDINKRVEFDLNDSMTVLEVDNKSNVAKFLTKPLDPERDMLMTHVASNLINNIIQPRKFLFSSQEQRKKIEDYPLIFFDDVDIDRVNKSNVCMQELRFTAFPKRQDKP